MTRRMRSHLNKRFLAWLTAGVLLAGGSVLAIVYYGVYNVSALTGHTVPVYKFLEYARIRAVYVRAPEPPENFSEIDWQKSGLRNYEKYCLQCHGAPGVAPEPFSLGMMPAPSAIVRVGKERSPAELYWVIENGIKMSGMPAWKYRLSELEMWELAALVNQLPSFNKAEYRALRMSESEEPENTETQSNQWRDAKSSLVQNQFSGEEALRQYNCSSCHEIAGIAAASYSVGPPLTTMTARQFIAGKLPMKREKLIQWIMNPTHYKPESMMPDLQVTREHAEVMVDYLYKIDKSRASQDNE